MSRAGPTVSAQAGVRRTGVFHVQYSLKACEGGVEGVGEHGDGDEARADFQRAADEELPDEQERHQPAPAAPAVGFEQVEVRSAGAGEHRAEFAPDQAVHEDQAAGDDPAEQGERPRQLAEHERDGDEDARADDHADVERGRVQQAEVPLQAGGVRVERVVAHACVSPGGPPDLIARNRPRHAFFSCTRTADPAP